MSPSIPIFSPALNLLAPFVCNRFGGQGPLFDCPAQVSDLQGATIKRTSSKSYRPRSQRKHGGRG